MFKIVNDELIALTQTEMDQAQTRAGDYDKNMLPQDIRNQRDRLLSDTDWMALSDNTMTPEWSAYRQALRDITNQEGFPYLVNWPTKP